VSLLQLCSLNLQQNSEWKLSALLSRVRLKKLGSSAWFGWTSQFDPGKSESRPPGLASIELLMDTLTPEQRSERMSRVRNRDTKPELLVRRLVHGMGYRYRLHRRELPGKPDLVFPARRKVIFVHGCFWHRHPDPTCSLARLPKSKLDFWGTKLETNRKRDESNLALLAELGWKILEVWECQTKNREDLQTRVREFLG
jgi:DNA mismatch endonuclease (patch repair protein)